MSPAGRRDRLTLARIGCRLAKLRLSGQSRTNGFAMTGEETHKKIMGGTDA
jgi:hypothetical protein